MESEGFETLHASPAFSNHLHSDRALGRIDFIYVDRETADILFGGARRIEWGQRAVLVPSPMHMIAMKVHAMKNDPSRTLREMADVQHLLSLPDVDRGAARSSFAKAGLEDRFDDILRFL